MDGKGFLTQGLVTMVSETMVLLCTEFTVGGETVDGLSAAGLCQTYLRIEWNGSVEAVSPNML